MPVKRDKYDDIFSLCIRVAANWTCERCQHTCPDGIAYGKSKRMQCAHIYGRRIKATRWHPDNAFCLCAGCHKELGDDPIQHAAFARATLGPTRYEALIELANSMHKWTRSDKAQMYQHYRAELVRLQGLGGGQHTLVSYQ